MRSETYQHPNRHIRTYDRTSSVVFLRTKEEFGGLSNMAAGFPLLVNDIRIRTSEALYQACRFPHLPDLQRLIIDQRSPMTAKMKGKPNRHESRSDWNKARINIMRWCLRVKLVQNRATFGALLLETKSRPIVEQSRKDDFWGAKPIGDDTLVGMNVLGRLLMELREAVKSGSADAFREVRPLGIPDFLLYGRQIETVHAEHMYRRTLGEKRELTTARAPIVQSRRAQAGRFDAHNEPSHGTRKDRHGRPIRESTRTASFAPYPSYRESQVYWTGKVPTHWVTHRLRRLALNVSDQTSERAKGMSYIALEHVESWTGHVTNKDAEPGDSQLKRFESGDVLFGKLRPYLAKVVHAKSTGLCVGEFLVLRRRMGLSARFLAYALRSKPVIDWINGSTYGARMPRADWAFVGNTSLPVPDVDEQDAISRFLDHVMSRIDQHVRSKEKLIALLVEQQLATINEAVTGQTDVETGRPYSSYRVSDVGWLRRVPSHWQTRRSKRVFRPRDELARPNDVQLSATQAYGVIPQADFEERVGRKVVRISQHLDRRRHVEIDDFVISMRSFQGGLERAWTSGCIRSSYVVLRATTEISCDFFGFLFKSVGYINALRSTANFIRDGQDLNFDNFCHVDLPFPPLDEQRRIGEALNKRIRAASRAIETSRREMALLSEFRQRLVADVVTGRLDVRQAASDLGTETSIADRTDISNPKSGQNSLGTQRGIAAEATS